MNKQNSNKKYNSDPRYVITTQKTIKNAIFEEDVDEISMSGAVGAYNTP